MTTIDSDIQPNTARFSGIRSMLAALCKRLEARRARIEARRGIEMLATLDDRTLSDVGMPPASLAAWPSFLSARPGAPDFLLWRESRLTAARSAGVFGG